MRDISNRTSVVKALAPAVVTADTNGSTIDLQGFNSATMVMHTGIEGDTLSGSVKFDFILEESDNGSSWSAVTSSTDVTEGSVDSSGIFLTLDDNAETPQVTQIGYIGGSQYIRVRIDATGSHSNGTPMSAVVVKGNPSDSEDA
jgi:hypothetical protein